MVKLLRTLDRALYRGEQIAAALLFVLMSLVMFASVTHRVFSREEGRLSGLAISIARRFGSELDPVFAHGTLSHVLNSAVAYAFVYLGFRTMRRETPLSRGGAALYAAGTTAVVGLSVKAILVLFPNGLVWGPVMSLCCMLWVGFLGASLATYERGHLALEMGDKIWPASVAPYIRRLAMFTSAAFCVFLLVLAVVSIADHRASWLVNHLAGNLMPTAIPKWLVFLIFPYAFVVMTLRFLGAAVAPAPGDEPHDTHGIPPSLIELEEPKS